MNTESTPRRPRLPLVPIILVTVGVLFLLKNFGILDTETLTNLWRFWPALLILVGFQMILPATRLGAALMGLVTLVIIGGIITYVVATPTSDATVLTTQNVSITSNEATGATSRSLSVEAGIGAVSIDDGASTALDTRSEYNSAFSAPAITHTTTDGRMAIKVATDRNPQWLSFRNVRGSKYNFTLGLPDLKTSLSVENGTGSTNITLKQVLVDDISVDSGTGPVSVDLTGRSIPTGNIKIETGTGSIKMYLPDGVGIRMKYDIGTGRATVDGTPLRGEGEYQTPNFDTAGKKVTLDIDSGTGSVTIERR